MQLIEKELSWLSFNERVLQEAADVNVPIIERVRFLGIYSSNLDEFFRVRVADLHRRLRLEQLGKVEPKGMSAENLLHLVNEKVQTLADRFNDIHIDVIKGLARRNIFLINNDQLNEKEGGWLRKYFRDEVLHHITPILVNENTKLASVMNDEDAYLMCALKKGLQFSMHFLKFLLIKPTDLSNCLESKVSGESQSSCSITPFAIALTISLMVLSILTRPKCLPLR